MINYLKRVGIFFLVFLLTLSQSLLLPTYHASAALATSRISVHDPSIVKDNGKYYLFGTHISNAVSNNLASWSSFTTNVNNDYEKIFAKGSKWASHGSSSYDLRSNLWAPDVIYNKKMKKWCMYMSVNGDNYYSSIALATSDKITGPYTYSGEIVYSGFTNSTQAKETDYAKVTGTNSVNSRYLSNGRWNPSYGPNAIDPCVLYDKDGNLWMSYGSWFGGLFMLKLDANTGLRDYSYKYETKTNVSDEYLGIKISGGYGTCGEGSYIVWDKDSGYYYLYESYCGLDATDNFSGYHIRLFRSKNITGPYTDAAGNSAICTSANVNKGSKGVKLFGNYTLSSFNSVQNGELNKNGYKSGGHNSALVDDDGQRYLIYHTRFNTGNEFHQVRVHQQFLNEDKWPVTAVYENLGDKISPNGYSTNDIVGTYDFINHGLDATTANIGMLKTSKVKLNANGTITGDYKGTWIEKSGTYCCTMVINGVTYKGVFFKQSDESASHKQTMTFSLIGSNNESIWGSKVSNNADIPYTQQTGGNSVQGLDGVYYIKNVLTGLYLDVENGSSEDGANIRQWPLNSSDAQKFKLVSDGNGYYSILTGASNYKSAVDVYNASAADGTNINQWTYSGGDMQKFEVHKTAKGQFAFLTKVSNSKSCLDVYEMSTDAGANIDEWKYWSGEGQLWVLEKVSSNNTTATPSSPSVSNNTLNLTYSLNNWGSAGQATIKISNNSNSNVNNWTLKLKKSEIKISTGWNVNIKESGDYYVITPVSWNSNIPSKGSIEFGIQYSGTVNKLNYTL
ncbi:MAG: RICIN domain-containing protein [Clostridium sp.]|nr:RICIN domain-containing protein [Clostridium sp.]